ncbi:MAG TPA: tetratricopeptide repeat protein, partial [Vicinamibacteria bacterium]
MREPSPRAPFDQGLFLTHFNKGKAYYDERRFEDAERELEEAYLLRPRDQKVLNLLGLVYFRQDKLEKAEEVYRKLTAESPEAHTLFYNLGLIYFKLSRLEDAESAFVKALELSRDNPKINFYLGSIYERLHKYQDAIYQYRQAGANLMVRRVEDKIAAGSPSRSGGVLASAAPDDTAEFNARDVREALRRRTEDTLAPGRPLQPVSESILADGAPKRVRTDTARFRLSAAASAAAATPAPDDSPTAQTLPPT